MEKLEKLRLECRKLQRDLDMELQLMERYEQFFVQSRYENARKMREAMADSMAFFEKHQAYFSDEPSFNCMVYYHFLHALECQVLGNLKGTANHYGEILELYDRDPREKMANQERYLNLLANYFGFRCFDVEGFSLLEFKRVLARMHALKGKDPGINFFIEQQGYYYQLIYFLNIGDYPQVMKLEAPIAELLAVHGKKMAFDKRIIFTYHLALANFLMGLADRERKERWLKKSLDWLNQIENMARVDAVFF
ncbi:MAG: hypothetical protein IPJ40_02750 [Saprospirales bacterium]|nr:hypothetical protein [Saprospirales bacterium]